MSYPGDVSKELELVVGVWEAVVGVEGSGVVMLGNFTENVNPDLNC